MHYLNDTRQGAIRAVAIIFFENKNVYSPSNLLQHGPNSTSCALKIVTMNDKLLFLLAFTTILHAQKNTKTYFAKRITQPPKIDAVLNDVAWLNVPVATSFIEYQPNNGNAASTKEKTNVRLVYNDNAIYVSAMLYDKDADKIPMEITRRDEMGQTDLFFVEISTNNDRQNSVLFGVMSTGVQIDAIVNQKDFNENWNAVWFSSAKVVKNGWIVEMKIPYSALRFPKRKIQTWGVNFFRKINSKNRELTWNYVNNAKGFFVQYTGILKGIENISPPIRLSFYPYVSTYGEIYKNQFNKSLNIGMDVKYGITENFTLDMTLIPDFGQTAFDKVTLNLGPFEQRFDEQRQFFIEGTELFGKGNMFYSRRIGGKPVGINDIKKHFKTDKIIKNPNKVNMLNAIKISGRTKNGMGIGFFNAITQKTEAILQSSNGETYKVVTEPLANYNMLVLDKVFNQNSISFVNTNVIREGDFRDANAMGLVYNLRTPNNKYFINGRFRTSIIGQNSTYTPGFNFNTSVGKDSGNWNMEVHYYLEDDKFDINDLGFLYANNSQGINTEIAYKILKPAGIFNFYQISSSFNLEYLYKPHKYTQSKADITSRFFTKDRLFFEGGIQYEHYKHDYFEPREPIAQQWFFKRNPNWTFYHNLSTDYRNKFALDYELQYTFFQFEKQQTYKILISPRYRFNNAFTLIYALEKSHLQNNQGYVKKQEKDIIFGQRERNNLENTLSGKYSFSVNTSLSLSFRHIWTTVNYQNQFYYLQKEGSLKNHSYKNNHNINYNSWNLDLNYI